MATLRKSILTVLLLASLLVIGAGTALADDGDDLINELMCPSSATLQPLATSGSADAIWMRGFIRAKAADGWSRQRILDTLVRQYGERILPEPPKEGFSLAAWIVPLAILVGGVGIVSAMLSGWLKGRKEHDAVLSAEMDAEMDPDELRRYEARLQEELKQFE